MKILNWMQKTLNAKQGSKKSAAPVNHFATQEPNKEETSNWHHGLLMIGTLGNNDMKDDSENQDFQEIFYSPQEISEFTLEEVGKLQKELTKLLKLKPFSGALDPEVQAEQPENNICPLNRFLNCPSSLEIDRTDSQISFEGDEKKEEFSNNSTVVLSKGKEVCLESKSVIRQKSVSFLLKKMFACRSGFAPVPSLRDSLPESRMDKFLRMIINRKIYPHSSSPSSSKKLLESKSTTKMVVKDQADEEKESHGYKWVKTDSEYIVLEM